MSKKLRTRKGNDGYNYPYTHQDLIFNDEGTGLSQQLENFATKDFVNESINNGPDSSAINAELEKKANKSDLAAVATSGSYDDLINKPDKLIYKDTTTAYKRIDSESSINSFDTGEGIIYCVIESLNLEEGKTYNAKVLAEHITSTSLNEPESLVDDAILIELKGFTKKDEMLSPVVGKDVISLSFSSYDHLDYLPEEIVIAIYDKVSIDSVDSAPFYAEDHALVVFADNIHYIDIGLEENIESEVTNEFLETYKFVTQDEKDSWNNKVEKSALNKIYSSLEDISTKVNEQLLYKEYFNAVDIDNMTNTTFLYRGYLAYKNVDGLLGIEPNKCYDLELVFSDDSIVKYSGLLSDNNKCISHDDGTILVSVADDTYVANNGSVNSYSGANKHSVYGYNITNLKQVKIYKSSEVNNEFLETHRFITEGFSGDYNDLTNKPTIPSVEGLATKLFVKEEIAKAQLDGGDVDLSGLATKEDLNGLASEQYVQDQIAAIEHPQYNDTELRNMIAGKADKTELFSKNYNDLTNKPDIPSKTSDLTNDSGFITRIPDEYVTDSELNAKGFLTEHQDISGKANKSDLAAVATSGSYNDLTNKPNIPSIEGLATEELVNNLNNDVVESINEINTELETKASTEFVNNMLSGIRLVQMTQSEYDALEVKDSNTLYIIK